jgi:hypothetical protein
MYKSPSNAQMQQVKKNLIKHTYSSVDSAKIIHKHYDFQLLHVNSRKSVFLKSSPLPFCLNYLRCKIKGKANDHKSHKSWWIKRHAPEYTNLNFAVHFYCSTKLFYSKWKELYCYLNLQSNFGEKFSNKLFGLIELYYLSHYDTRLKF